MQKQRHLISTFFFFFLLSGIFYGVSQTSFGMSTRGLAEVLLTPLRAGIQTVFANSSGKSSLLQQLKDENTDLRSKLAAYQGQAKEVQALRDQFAVTSINTQTLLPAKIVGHRSVLSGFSLPDQLILDKGKLDGVRDGSTVVYKDIFLGQITRVTDHLSVLDLGYRKNFSLTASVVDTGALGVMKGQGQGEMLLDNVILSDSLHNGSNVITKGSMDLTGKGVPPGLLIGKIISIDKKPSALFQTAKVGLALDVSRLTMVFILIQAH